MMNAVVWAFLTGEGACGASNATGKGVDGRSSGGSPSNVEIKFVHYAQSSKVTDQRDSSVSYASAYVVSNFCE
jgi:predicted class III extradiol MEMO1 family dioxygenase